MNPYTKAVLSVLRLVAAGLILTSLVYLSSFVFFAVGRKASGEGFFPVMLKGVPMILGVILWMRSYAIARKLTEDFDD